MPCLKVPKPCSDSAWSNFMNLRNVSSHLFPSPDVWFDHVWSTNICFDQPIWSDFFGCLSSSHAEQPSFRNSRDRAKLSLHHCSSQQARPTGPKNDQTSLGKKATTMNQQKSLQDGQLHVPNHHSFCQALPSDSHIGPVPLFILLKENFRKARLRKTTWSAGYHEDSKGFWAVRETCECWCNWCMIPVSFYTICVRVYTNSFHVYFHCALCTLAYIELYIYVCVYVYICIYLFTSRPAHRSDKASAVASTSCNQGHGISDATRLWCQRENLQWSSEVESWNIMNMLKS